MPSKARKTPRPPGYAQRQAEALEVIAIEIPEITNTLHVIETLLRELVAAKQVTGG